jgi:peptidoglycan-associated lipoprotein
MDKTGAIADFASKPSAPAHGQEGCVNARRGKGSELRHCLAIVAVLAVALIPGVSSAESSPPGALQTLQDFFARASAILSQATDAKQGLDDVRDLARALFDGRSAGRRALGPEWDRRTGPEQEEFARTFTATLEHAYLEMLRAHLPRDRPPAIRITDEQAIGDRGAVVRTAVQARNGSTVRFDYMMTKSNEDWRVHDVVIDGVSLLGSYRAQFARILRTSSYADLLARLRGVAGVGEPVEARGEESVAPSSTVGGPVAPPPSAEAPVGPPPSEGPLMATPSGNSKPNAVVAYFDTSRADLSAAARRDLDSTADWLIANTERRVVIEGHSDERGDARLNQVLAQRRANAVREHLVSRGVEDVRITTVTYGDRRPLCRKATETCWLQNRRAVLWVTPS